MQRIFSMELAGRTITAETGKYAEQAGGSVLMRCGDTAVLVCNGSQGPARRRGFSSAER